MISIKRLERLKDGAKPNFLDVLLLRAKPNGNVKTKNLNDLTFAEFVDCETFLKNEEFYKFCCIFAKPKWYQLVRFNHLESIVQNYANQKAELIEQNEFVFNPPIYGEPAPETVGSELRKEFVESFGIYVVLMDVVQGWDGTGFKAIENWKVSEFFFWANYLRGQKIVENVK